VYGVVAPPRTVAGEIVLVDHSLFDRIIRKRLRGAARRLNVMCHWLATWWLGL
jgi:hypothetical protein